MLHYDVVCSQRVAAREAARVAAWRAGEGRMRIVERGKRKWNVSTLTSKRVNSRTVKYHHGIQLPYRGKWIYGFLKVDFKILV